MAERDIVLGPGKIALLEAIEHYGSIAAACREMRLSYKKAWQLLETMSRHFDAALVDTSSGGSQRGGATLTPWPETSSPTIARCCCASTPRRRARPCVGCCARRTPRHPSPERTAVADATLAASEWGRRSRSAGL
ncbi:winged helix-turn-helix domain-containing protein [Salinicola tamaricis]|uniref:winged helix-turn-helix domain-containing protein n=1 Tax=Salinicola tamaricis TaxID=1771309 RepID=UPI001F5D83B1|nr:LysR family transcriptional regulator [Salinicola tamaricis]